MSTSVPICDIDFYVSGRVADPVSAYARMLSLGPVVWLEKNDIHTICGHSAIVASLRNHDGLSSGKGVAIDDSVNQLLIGSTLNSDPPQHHSS